MPGTNKEDPAARSSARLTADTFLRVLVRRLVSIAAILLVIAYVTLFGLILAERGRAGLPAEPLDAGAEALRRTLDYLINHPITYYWQHEDLLAPALVVTLFVRSAGLLVLSLLVAAVIGVPLGMTVALVRRLRLAPLVLLVSVLGVSTPSFLLAMLLWMINLQVYRWSGLSSAPLPPVGFGWDAHVIMPALVLAARPLAQIVQITYVSLSSVLGEDYVRTAHAKGLRPGLVLSRHAMRNILIPVLTTLGTSLRFSLASLPVVEAFFVWPGIGLTLLQAIALGQTSLVTDLIVSLGILFLVINLALDVAYQFIDPRLTAADRPGAGAESPKSWRERWADWKLLISSVQQRCLRLVRQLTRLRWPPFAQRRPPAQLSRKTADRWILDQPHLSGDRRSTWWMLDHVRHNVPLLLGSLMVLSLVALALLGDQLTAASPYETHGIMTIEGTIGVPPFIPSTLFPWGTDAVGRDIRAQVMVGARQTLTLALLGMLARVALGTALGVLAGWWRGAWLDRLINAAVAVWAAFPITLFAMIIILALGIKQGVSVFVIALCIVGWGEIAQFVRGQVTALKPQPYIHAAQAVGARTGWIVTKHLLPHLLAPLLVLSVLELGSVLMLLAELGYLDIFLGGGFKAEVGESGKMVPVVYFFSDVPEWGALLANIRNWWRSYPWLAWYPGLAFMFAILAFNVWGEGLRRLLEDNRVNIGRLISRYSLVAVGIALVGGLWLARSTAPIEVHRAQAEQFDAQRALQDIQALASPDWQGRESGTPGGRAAADYIAGRMKQAGLFPAGQNGTFFYTMPAPRAHLAGVPRLDIVSQSTGETAAGLVYRQDFVEYAGFYLGQSTEVEGTVVGIAAGPDPGDGTSFSLRRVNVRDKIVLVRQNDFDRLSGKEAVMAGVLIVSDDPGALQRRYVFPSAQSSRDYYLETPILVVTPQVADRLLATAGGSLAQLDELAGAQAPGQIALTESDTRVRINVSLVPEDRSEELTYVIGYIPGRGALMAEQEKESLFDGNGVKGLDSQVVMISAYYDGLGTGPNGTVYPGANDNASGVATMLEMARVLKTSPAQPSKTLVFVAWSGGERREGLSLAYVMNAKRGFHILTVEAVLELSGVGAGSGGGIALGPDTSFSLVQLFQEAADRMGVSVTTRGRGPHFGMSTESGFGGRSALSAYVSWDGSDQTAHTAADTFQSIQADKVRSIGQTALLVVSVLGRMEAQPSLNGPLLPPDSYIEGARLFDEAQAIKHVEYLANDTLAGRRPGTPGGLAAGDYVAARFAEYGLQPAAPDGTYYQRFTLPYTTVVESPDLTVTFSGAQGQPPFVRTYTYPDDYLPRSRRLGSGEATGGVVWLNSCSADSSGGHDLAGKIVLCRAVPPQEDEQLIKHALEQRVGGLLFIASDMLSPLSRSSYAGGDTASLPTFYITDAIGQDLLAGTGYRLYQLNLLPPPAALSTTVHMAAAIETHQVSARNVLGLLPGSDPERQDQIVVVGAHYDHLGTDPDGTVYNGANDNASGVAVLLEIARLWQEQGYRPARSVLFAAWDDEEQGGLGSGYYVRNPTRPLDRTVAMLELDMVGAGEEVYIVGRDAVADQLETSARVYSTTAEFTLEVLGGDSRSFHAGGVPAALLSIVEGPGRGSIYHRPEDDVETIQPAALRTAGVLAVHSLAAWAGGGPTLRLPPAGPQRTLRDLILPTPMCPTPWPIGAMTCDHGSWTR